MDTNSSGNKKVIQIDPNVLQQNSLSRAKKNSRSMPIIQPNVLKSKFLNRIKEHKKSAVKPSLVDHSSDEFSNSMEYLKQLSERDKPKHNRTLKAPPVVSESSDDLPIFLELNDSLKEVSVTPTTPEIRLISSSQIPYSNLRVGGTKPTYREWNKTIKHQPHEEPSQQISEREAKLNLIKMKLKQKQMKTLDSIQGERRENEQIVKDPVIQIPVVESKQPDSNTPFLFDRFAVTPPERALSRNAGTECIVSEKSNGSMHIENAQRCKKRIHKTVRYTIGKSKAKQHVGVLLKDRSTRKKVLSAQKELKRKSIKDIKNYLKDHNLIKVGSNAPNDVLRQLFESAMMSGDIMNKNKDTALLNFTSNEAE